MGWDLISDGLACAAAESPARILNADRSANPNLPVRQESAANNEIPSPVKVGAEAPQTQRRENEGKQRQEVNRQCRNSFTSFLRCQVRYIRGPRCGHLELLRQNITCIYQVNCGPNAFLPDRDISARISKDPFRAYRAFRARTRSQSRYLTQGQLGASLGVFWG